VIDAIDFCVWGAVGTPFRIRITIWNPADVNWAGFTGDGTSMINAAGVPLRVMEFPPAAGTFSYFNEGFIIANNPLPGGPLTLPSSLTGVYLEAQIIDTSGNPMPGTGDGAVFLGNNSGRGEPTRVARDRAEGADSGLGTREGETRDHRGRFVHGSTGEDQVVGNRLEAR
jgi:hypothetical protein